MNIAIYEKITGKIVISCSCPTGSENKFLPENGYDWIECQDTVGKYVKDGAIADRPAVPASISGKIIRGIPAGSRISINGENVGTADGTDIELAFDLPGDYQVKAVLFPYLDYEATIHAD
jgi:hypothetical protein